MEVTKESQNQNLGLLDENWGRKKVPLAHEFGIGSACIQCKNCPGLEAHFWRKRCKNCSCPITAHDLPKDECEKSKLKIGKLFGDDILFESGPHVLDGKGGLGLPRASASPTSNNAVPELKSKYDFVPAWIGSGDAVVNKYMEHLPEENRPVRGSKGSEWRKGALERQLPHHDLEPSNTHKFSPEEQKAFDSYLQLCKEKALGQGIVAGATKSGMCRACSQPMKAGEVCVMAPSRFGADTMWHPACFRCHKCKEILADLVYFYKDGQLFCGRHFGESVHPRCMGCDELIFQKEYTVAEERPYHLHHFCCFKCDAPLGGHKYMSRDNHPYCLTCYESHFAKTCLTCEQKIAADHQRVSLDDTHWHATAKCFSCKICSKFLLNMGFVFKYGQIFCSSKCKETYGQRTGKPKSVRTSSRERAAKK